MVDQASTAAAEAQKADLLSQAEDAVLEAVEAYRHILAEGPVLDSTEITYTPSKALADNQKFTIDPVSTGACFGRDGVFAQAAGSETPALQMLLLSFSPHWEDRIRAAVLQQSIRDEITMPDGFPCIFEPADSPRPRQRRIAGGFVWVASPDEEMLRELLPLYRELWGAYEAQWPHRPKRTFEFGRLDGVSPRGIYRPGTTPEQVIGQTMLTHADMYRTAPEHLREMHPSRPV